MFQRLAVIGMGLIGSSLARAAKASGAAAEIVAYDKSPEARETVRRLDLADRCEDSAAEAADGADLIVIATPIGAIRPVLEKIGPRIARGAIVSDVGSVKETVAQAFADLLPDHAIGLPAHPVAGTEQSGPEAGFAELFRDRWCILTPGDAPAEAEARLRGFWERLGAKVDSMDAAHHDRVLAVTSHLPHLIAYTIVGVASDLEQVTEAEVVKYSAGGFRDFTRIAASDPTMWRDIFLGNKDAVLELLGRFTEDLIALQRAIRWDDGGTLHSHFERTRAIRRDVIETGQDTAQPDFGRRVKDKPSS